MRNIMIGWLLLVLSGVVGAVAQTYPDYESVTVNDFAGLLSPEAVTEVSGELDKLRQDTGVEFTVVTLSRKAMFAPDQTLEQFATGLFNQWGIGNEDRNDGMLLLVLRGDREVRIELGAAFGSEWDRAAARVLDDAVLPAFREDRYEDGIRAGVSAAIAGIAMPFLEGAAPPSGSGVSGLWALALFVPVLLMVFWRRLKDRIAAMGKCPQCGHRALSVTRKVLQRATRASAGQGERVVKCSNCGYRDSSSYSISRISSSKSSSSSFGGGRSGGGGASGKW